ncbi:Serine/threonine-protein phosphatase 2A regulatory subunit B'' subunit gamma [Chytridiales sp. JEL 0842]|nr:Serine/threonine-protein phosphatase 2A regulatory subunit B'' subunit gamma [Chytridiales sp. JEL 0842]
MFAKLKHFAETYDPKTDINATPSIQPIKKAKAAPKGHATDTQPLKSGGHLDPANKPSSAAIPRFYFKKPTAPPSPVIQSFKEACFLRFLERQRQHLLLNEELDILWDNLCERATDGADEERFHRFFKASVYLRFVPDDNGYISVLQFFNYVLRKVSLMQARLDLSVYDADHDGYLTEEELQQYITDLIPSLKLESINKSFHKFYVCTAVRKFMFFLDPMRRGRVSIQGILLSPILTELFELREPDLPKDYEKTNWFSSYSTLRVYGQFLNLDVDHNGMLSRDELSKFNNGTLTDIFLDRIFQEYQTYENELDYKGFLDFVLAMENSQTPEAITYGFKLLDINGAGNLNDFTIRFLFKAVIERMVSFGHEPVGIEDVTNEVFDMANPSNPQQITLNDLLKCGVGGTIVNILSDCRSFWAYDNRENIDPK